MTEETTSQKRKRIEKRNKYRSTVCVGCHNNYYNFPKATSSNGDVAVAADYSCWHLSMIYRGRCKARP